MIKINNIAYKLLNLIKIILEHITGNILLLALSSAVSSLLFCLIFTSGDMELFYRAFLLMFLSFSMIAVLTGLIMHNEIGIYISLLDLSASSNIRKILSQKKPSDSSLLRNAIFTASFFHKILSKLNQTEENLYNESETLQRISGELYTSSRHQQNAISYVMSSSQKIDSLLESTNSNIKKVEKNAVQTLETSALIENNSANIQVLLDDLIKYIQDEKDILKRSEEAFRDSSMLVESINNFTLNTTSAMDELKSAAYDTHSNILKTIDLQKEVFRKVQYSEAITSGYGQDISDIRNNLSATLDIIEMLKSYSEQINKVLAIINKISKQTNLLSLNANIIAASSPEDKKSFAVVADEIHSLSKKTISSTSEILQIISNIDRSINMSSEASQASLSIVDQTQVFGRQVSRNLQAILDIARKSIINFETIQNSNTLQINRIEQVMERTRLSGQKVAGLFNHNSRLQTEFQHLMDLSTQLIDITNGLKGRMSIQLANTKSLIDNTGHISTLVNAIVESSSSIKKQSLGILESFNDVSNISRQALYTVKDLTNISYQIHNEYNRIQSLTEYFTAFTPKRGNTLRIFFPPIDIDFSYDPALCRLIEAVPLYRAVYETLVETESGYEIIPLLCERYEVSHDFSEYTFRLKDNVYFHNLKKMTSSDVKFSFERLWHVLGDNAEGYLGSIKGWEAFSGNGSDSLAGIQVLDELTLRITLGKSLPYFLQILSTVAMSIVPASEKFAIDKPVGTGAYRFLQREGQNIILEKFDSYHIDSLPYASYVHFISKEKKDILETDYHIVPGHQLPTRNVFTDIDKLVNTQTELHSEILDPNSVSYLILNAKVYPFNIKEVRQAVFLCIDRERLVEQVFNRINKKAESIIPPNVFSYEPRKDLIRHDMAHAGNLVKRAGIKTPVKLKYFTNTERFQDPAINYVLNSISALGIEVEYIFAGPREYEIQKSESAMTLMIWFADYPDPDNFFSTFASENIDNRALGWINEEYISIISQARTETDMHKRKRLYNRAEEILLDDAVIIPLYYNKYFLFHHYDVICPIKTVFPFYDIKSCWFYSGNKEKINKNGE